MSESDNTLDSLKQEILNSLEERQRAPMSWGSLTMSVILGVLALISIIQVTQSASLYSKLKSGDLKSAAAPAESGAGVSSALPAQVGGC